MNVLKPQLSYQEPPEKSIKIYVLSLVPDEHAPVITVPALVGWEPLQLQLVKGMTAMLRIPTGPFRLSIDTLMADAPAPITVQANVVGKFVENLAFEQSSPHHVTINVGHTGYAMG